MTTRIFQKKELWNPGGFYLGSAEKVRVFGGSIVVEKTEPSIFSQLKSDRPYVYDALVQCAKLLASKGHDYTTGTNDFENFDEQIRLADVQPRQVFRSILAQKLNREKAVYQKGEAKHESRHDTLINIANYCILWLAYETKNSGILKEEE